MQVADFTRCYPLILESDALSLSSAFALQDLSLHDQTIGAQHQLQPEAREIISALLQGITLEEFEKLAESLRISPRQLDEIVGFLNFVGAIKLKRSPFKFLEVFLVRVHGYTLHIRYSNLSWRRDASLAHIAQGLLRATWPFIVISPLTILLIYISGIINMNQWLPASAWWLIIFFGSFYLHELAHVYVIRRTVPACDAFQRGLRFGVIHKPLPATREILSSLAGPLTGVSFCSLTGTLAYATGNHTYGYMAGIIGVFHTLSILPWYGDGKSLYACIKQLKRMA